MSRFRSFARAFAALPVIVAGLLPVLSAHAGEIALGDLAIGQAWSRATAPTAPTGVVYLAIESHGAADRLVSAAGDVADMVEIHSTSTDEAGMMQMRPADGVEIPAGGAVALAPGGTHIMLMGLHAPLKQGTRFPLTLTFEHAGPVTVEVEVQSAGSTGPDE